MATYNPQPSPSPSPSPSPWTGDFYVFRESIEEKKSQFFAHILKVSL